MRNRHLLVYYFCSAALCASELRHKGWRMVRMAIKGRMDWGRWNPLGNCEGRNPRKQRQTLWLLPLCSLSGSEGTVVSCVGVWVASQSAWLSLEEIRFLRLPPPALLCWWCGRHSAGSGRFSVGVYWKNSCPIRFPHRPPTSPPCPPFCGRM
jgi:hypothetical protein